MIGIDIVAIDRIQAMMSRFGDKALKRFLTQEEITLVKKVETAAGFWAIKEAASKALGCGIGKELSFLDMQIEKNERNAPSLRLKKSIIEKFDIRSVELSVTHDSNFAVAVVRFESNRSADMIKEF